jgi:hypothetical protein
MDLNCVIKDLLSWQTTLQHCFLHAATGKSLWLSWNIPKYFFTFLLGNRSKLFSPYYIQNSLINFHIFVTSSFILLDPRKAPVVHSGYHLLHINFSVYYLSFAPAALTIDAFHCLRPVSWQAYLDCIVKLLKLEAQSKGTNPNQDLRRAWIRERAQCGGTVLNLLCPVGGKFTYHHSERIPVPLLECTLLRWQHLKCTTPFQFEKHSQLWQVICPSDRFLMAWLETTPWSNQLSKFPSKRSQSKLCM